MFYYYDKMRGRGEGESEEFLSFIEFFFPFSFQQHVFSIGLPTNWRAIFVSSDFTHHGFHTDMIL